MFSFLRIVSIVIAWVWKLAEQMSFQWLTFMIKWQIFSVGTQAVCIRTWYSFFVEPITLLLTKLQTAIDLVESEFTYGTWHQTPLLSFKRYAHIYSNDNTQDRLTMLSLGSTCRRSYLRPSPCIRQSRPYNPLSPNREQTDTLCVDSSCNFSRRLRI